MTQSPLKIIFGWHGFCCLTYFNWNAFAFCSQNIFCKCILPIVLFSNNKLILFYRISFMSYFTRRNFCGLFSICSSQIKERMTIIYYHLLFQGYVISNNYSAAVFNCLISKINTIPWKYCFWGEEETDSEISCPIILQSIQTFLLI